MSTALVIPILSTERLRLEPLSMAHSCGMFSLWSDPAVCRYSGVVTDYDRNVIEMPAASPAESDRIIQFWLRAAEAGWGFRWAVSLVGEGAEDGAFAGTVGFNSLADVSEIAYHLLPVFWGRGIMSEACRAAVDWRRAGGGAGIEAFVEAENVASVLLAERLGMKATGEIVAGALRYAGQI